MCTGLETLAGCKSVSSRDAEAVAPVVDILLRQTTVPFHDGDSIDMEWYVRRLVVDLRVSNGRLTAGPVRSLQLISLAHHIELHYHDQEAQQECEDMLESW